MLFVCYVVSDSVIKCSHRSWSPSRTLRRWSSFAVSCWRSWTRVSVWERHSSTTVQSAWVNWGRTEHSTRLLSTSKISWMHHMSLLNQMCGFVCVSGSECVYPRLKTLSRRPGKSVSCWDKVWETLCWSERTRPGSGGMRMRRMEAEDTALYPQSQPPRGCPSTSASKTEAGKNSKRHLSFTHETKELTVTL